MINRLLAITLAATGLAALAGCGDGQVVANSATRATAPAPIHLGRHELALGLGNGFRAALDRLAVLQQPRDGAADLGQDLPAGLLRDVRCATSAARPAGAQPWPWRCDVRWETTRGTPKSTAYAVRLLATGCFAAGATPRLHTRFDPTINTYAEHPLNTITSVRKGC
ncbi:MAG: hypothetical protein JWQ20_2574 [Conexibacter sp.]|nr:hypothetical protein [Conexibacter sp.]